jgi:hypothetical protein
MRATDDAELHTRVQAFVPTFREVVAALDALQVEREAAKAAPAVPPRPPAAPAALPQADLQALVQQAVQQALAAAAANGQAPSTPPPAAPSGTAPDDQQTGFCSIHQAEMTQHTDPASGDTWYSHYLEDAQRYCKGARPSRRNGHRR